MEFTVGKALGDSFGIWFKNLIPFTLLSALVQAPFIALSSLMVFGHIDIGTPQRLIMWSAVELVFGYTLQLICTGAIVYGVFEEMRGAHVSLGRALGVGLQRLLPVIGVGILVGLCVVGGFILLVIPGLIIFLMLYVAVPVAVVERSGLMAALKRSRELTRGARDQSSCPM